MTVRHAGATAETLMAALGPRSSMVTSEVSGARSERWLAARIEALHERSFAWALTCCRGHRLDAEDVLQTVYCKILDGRARWAGRSRFDTWLFSVVWRTAAALSRRRAWRRVLRQRWWRGEPSSHSEAPPGQHRLEDAERDAAVHAALDTLSERQRQILELVFFHDLSLRQAAEVIGIRLGTARVHYRRGKASLRRRLREVRP